MDKFFKKPLDDTLKTKPAIKPPKPVKKRGVKAKAALVVTATSKPIKKNIPLKKYNKSMR